MPSIDVAAWAMAVLTAAKLNPREVHVVETGAICFVDTAGHARTAWIRYVNDDRILVEAVTEGWSIE